MSNTVRVWNKHNLDHTEKFKGQVIHIPAGKCIEMDYFEAIAFKGQMVPYIRMKNGLQDPKSYKMIDLDKDDVEKVKAFLAGHRDEEKEKVYVCERCGKEFLTKNGLMKHIKKNHLDDMVEKEARDELIDDEDV